MRRREFIAGLGSAAAAWPLAARAQQRERMRRIGIILPASADDASEIAAKMKIGAELMASGDITAARMMFERAAEAGEAAAAFALAETYDPVVLRRLRLRGGIAPDVALARRWYEKARDLGSIAAPERIVRLTQIPQ